MLLTQSRLATPGEEQQQLAHFRTAVPVRISGIQAPVTEGGTEQTADAMEALSAAAHRGRVPWQGLLLAGKEGTIPGGGPEDGGRGCLGLLGRTAL